MDYLKLRGEIGTSDLSSNIKDPSPKSDGGRRFTTGLGDAPKPYASPASTLDRPLKKFSAPAAASPTSGKDEGYSPLGSYGAVQNANSSSNTVTTTTTVREYSSNINSGYGYGTTGSNGAIKR